MSAIEQPLSADNGDRSRARRVIAAVSGQMLARLLAAASGAVVIAVLARSLSVQDFGTFSLGLTLVTIGLGLTDFGVSQVAIQRMSAAPAEQRSLVAVLLATRTLLGSAFAAVAAVVAVLLVDGSVVAVWAMLLAVPFAGLQAYVAYAQVVQRIGVISTGILVQNAAWLVAVVFGAAVGAPLLPFAIAYAATSALSGSVAWVLVRRAGFSPDWRDIRHPARDLLKAAWPFGLGGLLVMAYYRLNAILVYGFGGPEDLAHFALAFRVIDVLQLVPISLQTVLLPALSLAFANGAVRGAVTERWTALFSVYLAAAAVIVTAGWALAPQAVSLLGGQQYGDSAGLLRILMPAFGFICVAYAMTGALVAAKVPYGYLKVVAVWAVINVVANLFLLPRYGTAAAAWTTLVTEAGVAASLGLQLRKADLVDGIFGPLARASIAVAAALAVAALAERGGCPPAPLVVAAIGVVVGLLAAGGLLQPTRRLIRDRRAVVEGK